MKNQNNDWVSHFQRLDGAYAPATLSAYYADICHFVDWCAKNGIEPWPSSVEILARYVTEEGQRKSPATVGRRLVSIGKMHKLMGLPDATKSEDVILAVRRLRRMKGTAPAQARGLSLADLEQMIALEPASLVGLRNKAILALGYEMLARRSELVALTDQDIEPRTDGTLRVFVRRSKNDPFGKGRLVYSSTSTRIHVENWISARGEGFPRLFSPIYRGKPIKRELNSITVVRVIEQAASRLGPSKRRGVSGHSLRVGAAQELLCAGYDTAAIMRAGGWKSVTTLARYLEYADHNVWQETRSGVPGFPEPQSL